MVPPWAGCSKSPIVARLSPDSANLRAFGLKHCYLRITRLVYKVAQKCVYVIFGLHRGSYAIAALSEKPAFRISGIANLRRNFANLRGLGPGVFDVSNLCRIADLRKDVNKLAVAHA